MQPLRPYQVKIMKECVKSNTLVLLPTGSGKTLIAATAILERDGKSLFLVPTIPLVSQQAAALRSVSGMPLVSEYHGDIGIPENDFQVLVSTPKAFETTQQKGICTFQWSSFETVVFDEVHHVVKDHPYRTLATKLRLSSANPRIIGLTASLTYAVGENKIEKSIQKLCNELNIEKIERATNEELIRGGYNGAIQGSVAEVRMPSLCDRIDIVQPEQRKPHLMHRTFFERIINGSATPFALKLVARIREVENEIRNVDSKFNSPLQKASLKSWGVYAHGRLQFSPHYQKLEHFYEALRLLITSWEEADEASVLFLRMAFHNETPDSFLKSCPIIFRKFSKMSEVLFEKISDSSAPFRGILFVQQRVMTHVIKYYLENDNRLGPLIRSRCLYATKTPATASLKISAADAKESLRMFGSGEANLLISTNVAEEGLDIPASNCVIYFDPINQAVSYVQGRGRARQVGSSFVMLDERRDRPASLLAKQELEQHAVASSFVPKGRAERNDADMAAQAARERGAASVLSQQVTEISSVGTLNLYCKKTKALCEETISRDNPSKEWLCKLKYLSILRSKSVVAKGGNRKQAKRKAAIELLSVLRTCSTVRR